MQREMIFPKYQSSIQFSGISSGFLLMSTPGETTREHMPPHLDTVMDSILKGFADEANAMTKSLGTIHAEYRLTIALAVILSGSLNASMLNPMQPRATMQMLPRWLASTVNRRRCKLSTFGFASHGVPPRIGKFSQTRRKKVSLHNLLNQFIYHHWSTQPLNPAPQTKHSPPPWSLDMPGLLLERSSRVNGPLGGLWKGRRGWRVVPIEG